MVRLTLFKLEQMNFNLNYMDMIQYFQLNLKITLNHT